MDEITREEFDENMIEKNSDITRAEMAERLDMSIGGVKHALRRMSEKGMIHFEGSSKKGYWVIDQRE